MARGRKSSYSAEEIALIEANYMSMTDKELSLAIKSVSERELTAEQIKKFRERGGLSRHKKRQAADTQRKGKAEDVPRLSVSGAVTTHGCL